MDFVSQARNFSFWFLSTAHVLIELRLQRVVRAVCIEGHFFSFLQFSQRLCQHICVPVSLHNTCKVTRYNECFFLVFYNVAKIVDFHVVGGERLRKVTQWRNMHTI